MNARPFYYTWSHQPDSDVFPVDFTEHDEFVLKGGRRVYDFLSTSFQSNFGHSHPAIREAIHRQLDQMAIASPKSTFDLKERVAERLCGRIGLEDGKIFFTVSGAESVENALKMARQITGRTKVMARDNSYHGATLGALSVTGDWRNEPHFTIDEQTIRIPEPSEDSDLKKTREIVADAGNDSIAAVIVETVSGTNGVVIPSQAWFDGLSALCQEQGIMLIIDEVLCGFGRTGTDFTFQQYSLQPDFVCMSKGISGGYVPFGAVWTGPQAAAYYAQEKMACGLTNFAHPLGLAALEAVLNLMDDSTFLENRKALEQRFKQELKEIEVLPSVSQIRCRGLLAAIDLLGRPAPTWQTMFDAGLHAFSSGNTIVLSPPHISSPARLSEAMGILKQLLKNN